VASKSSRRRRKRRPGGGPQQQRAAGADEAAAPTQRRPTTARRRGPDDERPPAPWGSFPLVELAVLTGIVMLIAGLVAVKGERGTILIGTGLVLASIGGLELSIREHFAGYRSHTLVLAGVPAAVVLGVLFYAGPDGLPSIARALIGLAVFAAAAALLVRVFRDRSGGRAYRFSGFSRR
jgi:uncharacterized membrane protein YhaH (DUF805 family)